MANDDYHVVPQGKPWAVKQSGIEEPISTHSTKAQAVTAARSLAQRDKASLKIHNKDGKIAEERTYGKDPPPPKG